MSQSVAAPDLGTVRSFFGLIDTMQSTTCDGVVKVSYIQNQGERL